MVYIYGKRSLIKSLKIIVSYSKNLGRLESKIDWTKIYSSVISFSAILLFYPAYNITDFIALRPKS